MSEAEVNQEAVVSERPPTPKLPETEEREHAEQEAQPTATAPAPEEGEVQEKQEDTNNNNKKRQRDNDGAKDDVEELKNPWGEEGEQQSEVKKLVIDALQQSDIAREATILAQTKADEAFRKIEEEEAASANVVVEN